ncbi:hypothetical protein [Natronobeatus ordinarius]|uniref:hypothetical protein n=1 Tax=Natronobeatus ordinarius TaxID=2963433 RepID=UPI0020CC8A35|nr:hypothetical protein [Natronobeatus ordinarius]
MRRASLSLVLAFLVVLAGCGAPVADSADVDEPDVRADGAAADAEPTADGNSEQGSDDDRDERAEDEADELDDSSAGLEVRGGELPFDENRTFERVQELLEVELRPPVVYVQEPLGTPRGVERNPSSFYAVMNVSLPDPDDTGDELGVGGVASAMNAVYVMPGDDADPAEVERVLVHELVHAAQFQQRVPQAFHDSVPSAHQGTTDADLASVSVMEAGAVYGSTAYTDAYDADVEPEGALLERLYPDASPGTKLVWGPYYYGYQYVDERYDSPAEHWALYEDPPVTMRAVMAGDRGSETELEPFGVRLAAGDTNWRLADTDTKGAFVTKQVLGTELEAAESRDVTSAWAYDRLVRASHDDVDLDGYAWSIRFETAEDAEAFDAAVTDYLDSRATSVTVDGESIDGDVPVAERETATWYADGYAYGLSSVDDRTVAILAGPDAFVESAAVESAGRSDVRVVVDPDRDERASSVAAPAVEPDGPVPAATAPRGAAP